MDKIKFYVGDHHNLEGATCHFIDYICGELDAFLEEEVINRDHTDGDDYYESICTFGDGSVYELEIGWNDETDEWNCVATKKS